MKFFSYQKNVAHKMQQNEYEQNYNINPMGLKTMSKKIRKLRPVSPIRSFILIRTAIIFKIYSV